MSAELVVYRRDLPGGRIVTISLDERASPGVVVGRLMLERRTDPTRRGSGEPPIVAEVRGAPRADVLASLRAVAESEGEVGRRLEAWLATRRDADAVLPPGQRVRMGDGTWWSVERHEGATAAVRDPRDPRDRAIHIVFHGGNGALRRATVSADFPQSVGTAELQALWEGAEVVR